VRDAIVAVVFVCVLALPSVVGWLAGSGFDPALENRTAAPLPPLRPGNLASFPAAFERWFGDHFGLRTQFVRWTSRAKVAIRVSPSPKVVIGRDGFLFYAGESSIELYQRALPLSDVELERWRKVLAERHAALALRGIRYVVLFPPDKEGVYSRRLPEGIPRLPGPSELDQVLATLASKTSVAAVDVRPSIEQARADGLVYFATDTHWNGRGIFAASRSVLARIHEWLPQTRLLGDAEVSFVTRATRGGDLASMLGLPDDLPERAAVECRVLAPRASPVDPELAPDPKTPPHLRPRAWQVDDPKLPRALVLGDSFMVGLAPVLAEGFSRTLYVGNHELEEALVDREAPDVVIEEWIERYIVGGPPSNAGWLEHAAGVPVCPPRRYDQAHPPGEPLPPIATWAGNELNRVEGGLLQATGDDPFIATTVSPFEAEPSLAVWVPLVAEGAAPEQRGPRYAQLFWSVEGAPFTEEASVRFPVLVDGAPHTYQVFPSFSRAFRGRVTSVRLDFPGGLVGLRYRVGEIEISAPAR
jgi:alginate O-acetyltransferase complex protein AlgJ